MFFVHTLFSLLLSVILFFTPVCSIFAQEVSSGDSSPDTDDAVLEISAPSAVLLELSTGQILFEKSPDERRSPASITKIMTLLLIFEELEKGNLKMEDEVVTSTHAKSMGGSQVFLEEGEKQTVETLIKCIVVASGNDASVAMAEHIAGSEEAFVARMNEKTKELGMMDTHFEDCCGLTDSDSHYTCARDVGIMSHALVSRFPKILEYSSIWMEDITHVTNKGSKPFTLSNTNKLIKRMEGCVGLKTGSTSKAKFCVSAVAKRNNLTLIAVVMGAPDPKGRFKDAAEMLNYGFGVCHVYEDENKESLKPVEIEGGRKETVKPEYKEKFSYMDITGMNLEQIKKEIQIQKGIKAPVKKGQVIGKAVYKAGEKEIGRVDIISTEEVKETDLKYMLWKTGRSFLLWDEKKKAS